ncbi:uncharacterized protein DS421_2g35530 [Arachis hypogaea]|nr:uncharacterized protein DS421_2g35530 [Arachis hypogaea]
MVSELLSTNNSIPHSKMKKFFTKLKSCYCPHPTTNKKKLSKCPPSSGRITKDRRDSSVDHNEVIVTKPQKKLNVVLPSDDYKNNREWWKSMPIAALGFAFSMS